MTTPPNGSATDGATTTEEPPTAGPRVTGEQMRDLTRLRRSSTDRKIAGVAGGIARHFDIDPLLVRVALVVLVFFGGSGVILYAAGWLLIPDEHGHRATIPLDDRSRNVALWIAAALAALSAIGDSLGQWHFPWPLLVVAAVVLFVISRRHHRHHRWTPPPPWPPSGATTGAAGATPPPPPPPPGGDYTQQWEQYYAEKYAAKYAEKTAQHADPSRYAYQPPARDPRRRGPVLFGFTIALAALGIGTLLTFQLAGADIPGSAYAATVAASCGLMLVVSAWFGRGGGLIPVGLLALVAMLVSSVVGDWHGGRIVDRPTTAASVQSTYHLGIGELRLDLTRVGDLQGLDGRTIDIQGRVGHVLVVVPDTGLDVTTNATIDGGGETLLFGDQQSGTASATHDGGATAPRLTIDADLVFGQIEVTTEAAR